MATELRNENNPLDANMEKVLPGLHQWHNINGNRIERVERALNTLSSNINVTLQTLKEETEAERYRGDQRLAETFRRLADSYGGNNNQPMEEEGTVECQPESPAQPQATADTESDWTKYLVAKHQSLLGLYNEWHGLEEYEDQFGGIKGREDRFGASWRRGTVNSKQFSRTKQVIDAIAKFAEEGSMPELEAVAFLEEDFVDGCKCSVTAFVKNLKKRGLVTERPPRFKKKKHAEQSNVEGAALNGTS